MILSNKKFIFKNECDQGRESVFMKINSHLFESHQFLKIGIYLYCKNVNQG